MLDNQSSPTSRPLRAVSVVAGVAGAILFAWSMEHAGTTAVADGFRRIGSGVIVVVLLGGVRALVRTAAWRLCFDPEDRLPLRSMLAAYLAGDAIGNVTPFGFLISEPSKIVMVRERVSAQASIVSLALENLFYSATVVVMLIAGTGALLLSFPLARPLRIAGVVVVLVILLVAAASAWIVATRRRVVSGAIEWLARHRIAPRFVVQRLPDIRQAGDRIFGFALRRPRAVVPLLLLETSYHVAAIAEIWFALGLITGGRPPLLTAFVLEAVNRTITTVFQFVPLWLGVDEAGTAALTSAVHLGSAAGVSLALVRKTRVVIWTAIGFLLLLRRGWSVGAAGRQAGVVVASE